MDVRKLIDKASEFCGGRQIDLARKCGVSPQRLNLAYQRNSVSAMLAVLIDEATGGKVPKEKLCPGVFARK